MLMLKRFTPVLICLLALALSTRFYLHPGVPITHDGENHLARFANYKLALKQGQFPPRWAPNLVNGYGYPVFNYNYPLPNLLSVPFSAIKLSYETTFKILMTFSLLFLTIGCWYWLQSFSSSPFARVLTVLVLLSSPYLLSAVVFRGNIGEVLALAFIPWLLLSVESTRPTPYFRWRRAVVEIGAILLWAGFFLAHNVTVVLALPLIWGWAWFYSSNRVETVKRLALYSISALGLTLWFWLPALAELPAVVLSTSAITNQVSAHLPTLQEVLTGPLQFGFSYPGSVDSLSFQLGWVSVAAVLLGWLRAAQKRFKGERIFMLALGLTTVLALLQLPWAQAIWQLPGTGVVQFPWRLTLFFVLFSLPMVVKLFASQEKVISTVLLILLFFQLRQAAGVTPVGYTHKVNLEYEQFPQSTSTLNENLPTTFTLPLSTPGEVHPQFLTGGGEIEIMTWNGSEHRYRLQLTQPSTVVEPTAYFPGWQTVIQTQDGRRIQLPYAYTPDTAGRIHYSLEPGEYAVFSRFTQQTWPRIAGNSVSLGAWMSLALIGAVSFTQELRHRFKKKS